MAARMALWSPRSRAPPSSRCRANPNPTLTLTLALALALSLFLSLSLTLTLAAVEQVLRAHWARLRSEPEDLLTDAFGQAHRAVIDALH